MKESNKSHIITSIDAEIVFDKIQHPWIIKMLTSLGIEGNYHNIIKPCKKNPTANIILNGKRLKDLILKIKKKARCPLSLLLSNIVLGVLGRVVSQEKEIKSIQTGKEVKFSMFADDIILYILKTLKIPHKTMLELKLIQQIVGYRVAHKNWLYFYT